MARGSRDAPDPWGPELMPHPYEQVPEEERPVRGPSRLPVLDQPPGRHRRRHPTRGRRRPAGRRQPQRLQGVGTVRCQGRRRPDHGHRGRRLSGHRPGHPAPPRTRQTELPAWKEERNTSHRKVRARLEHVGARMKTWKILRECHLKGDGIHTAMLGIARIHNVALTGSLPPHTGLPLREAQGRRLPTRPSRRMLSRDRTRCPRCPASRCTTHCGHRQPEVARVSRRARPVVRTRLRAWPDALHPRARCRPARQDAADS